MAAHRAWRVRVDTVMNNGRGCVVAREIIFKDAPGGNRLATIGGTAIAHATSSQYSSANGVNAAFDQNTNTIWHDPCGVSGTRYIGYDFGIGNEKDVKAFSWHARGDGYGNQDSIRTGALEYSDDLVTWTTSFTILQPLTWSDNQVREFSPPVIPAPTPGGHRYWRLRFLTFGNSSQINIAEIEMAETAGGPNVIDRSYVGWTASGSYGGFYDPIWAIDGTLGNSNGEWAQSGNHDGKFVRADFGTSLKTIREVRIAPGSDNGATSRYFAVEWSDDGSTWTEDWIGIYTGTYTWQQFRTFTKPAMASTYRCVGFVVTQPVTAGYTDLAAAEIEMSATVNGPDLTGSGTPRAYPDRDNRIGAAFNNNFTDEFYSGAQASRPVIWYDFQQPTVITEIRYTRRTNNDNWRRAPLNGFIIYGDNTNGFVRGDYFNNLVYTNERASIPVRYETPVKKRRTYLTISG